MASRYSERADRLALLASAIPRRQPRDPMGERYKKSGSDEAWGVARDVARGLGAVAPIVGSVTGGIIGGMGAGAAGAAATGGPGAAAAVPGWIAGAGAGGGIGTAAGAGLMGVSQLFDEQANKGAEKFQAEQMAAENEEMKRRQAQQDRMSLLSSILSMRGR